MSKDRSFLNEVMKQAYLDAFRANGVKEEELKEFVGVDLSRYKTIKVGNAEFRELSPEDYLKFYKKALKERDFKIKKMKIKIRALEKSLENNPK